MSQADETTTTNPSGIALTKKGERYAMEQGGNAEYFASLKTLRREAAQEIDRLLAFLDEIDGDVDLEDDDDEPAGDELDASWPTGYDGRFLHHIGEDAEEDDAGEDNGDLEPSLGHGGGDYDAELDTSDIEPSLGWTEAIKQDGDDWNRATAFYADAEQAVAPSPAARKRLRARRKLGKPLNNIKAEQSVLGTIRIVGEARW